MQQEYYAFPLDVERLMRRQEHPRISLHQSVVQNLHVLLTTAFGEFPADDQFGCSIWDSDFDNLTSAPRVKESMRQSIQQSVLQYEKRLQKPRVELTLQQEEMPELKGRRVKKRIEVVISGILQLTNERFTYRDSFFVGPLSY